MGSRSLLDRQRGGGLALIVQLAAVGRWAWRHFRETKKEDPPRHIRLLLAADGSILKEVEVEEPEPGNRAA